MQSEEEKRQEMSRPVERRFNPAAVAEAMEDPEIFEQVARGDLYVQLHHLRQLAANAAFPVSHRLDYAKFLAKMGKVEKPDVEANAFAGVPAINIILPNSGQSTRIDSASKSIQGEYAVKDTEDA